MSVILEELLSLQVLVPLALLAYLAFRYIKSKTYEVLKNIPGPPESPCTGNLNVVYDCNNFYELNYKIYRMFDKYGSMFKLWICQELWICISDVAKIKELFDNGLYNIVPVFNFFNYNSKKTLVVSNCPYKREEYEITLDPMVDNEYMVSETENLISHLESKPEQSIEDTRKTIEKNVRSILLNTQWRVRAEKLEYNRCGNWFLNRYVISVLRFLDSTQATILNSIFKGFNIIHKNAPLFDENFDADSFGNGEGIDDNTVRLEMVQSEHRHLQEKLTGYVEEHILLSSRRIAGFLVHLLQNITANPKIKKSLQDEVKKSLGNKTELKDPVKFLKELRYTDMVVKEGLRLYCPPAVFKTLKQPYDIYSIPDTAVLYISAFHIHRNHEHYEEPVVFHPEHFTPENEAKRSPYAYYPLELEPFNSLDKQYGVNILKLLLVNIISKFSFETSVPLGKIEHDYFSLEKKVSEDILKLTPLKKK